MKTNLQYILAAALIIGFCPMLATAQIESQTFVSKVVVVPSTETGTTKTYSYKIYGPDKVEYILDGTSDEVERLSQTIKTNPDAVVSFQGQVIDSPSRTFRFTKWEKSSSTATRTDAQGNRVTVHKEETTTH